MKVKLVKRSERTPPHERPDDSKRRHNPTVGPQRWVEEFRARKAKEKNEAFALIGHDAA
jgi:hypothetical protein